MNTEIQNYLQNLRFGETQSYLHIFVVPLHGPLDGAPLYVGLADAMDTRILAVTEVSEGGSVPQLLVVNDGQQPVLIIDGEELIGAKQNRILNTSLLLKERSRTVVPVSCTEQGRWAYASTQFAMSDSVLERKIRSRKSHSVSESLAHEGMPLSDQAEVWEGIQAFHCKSATSSPTAALNDAFKAHAESLNQCLRAFPRKEGQVGLLVLINGVVAGLDVVSRPEVYARLHEKLIRSYVLDALLDGTASPKTVTEASANAQAFLATTYNSREEVFPSVGYGSDHRYSAPGLTGNALVHEGHLIHAAFLSLDAPARGPEAGYFSWLRQRRHSRNR